MARSASIPMTATPFSSQGPTVAAAGPPTPHGEIASNASPSRVSTVTGRTHDSSRYHSGALAPRLVASGGNQLPRGKRPSGRGAENGAKRSRLRSCIDARSSAAPASTGRPEASLTVTRKVSARPASWSRKVSSTVKAPCWSTASSVAPGDELVIGDQREARGQPPRSAADRRRSTANRRASRHGAKPPAAASRQRRTSPRNPEPDRGTRLRSRDRKCRPEMAALHPATTNSSCVFCRGS
jgi:hypothetical protein